MSPNSKGSSNGWTWNGELSIWSLKMKSITGCAQPTAINKTQQTCKLAKLNPKIMVSWNRLMFFPMIRKFARLKIALIIRAKFWSLHSLQDIHLYILNLGFGCQQKTLAPVFTLVFPIPVWTPSIGFCSELILSHTVLITRAASVVQSAIPALCMTISIF